MDISVAVKLRPTLQHNCQLRHVFHIKVNWQGDTQNKCYRYTLSHFNGHRFSADKTQPLVAISFPSFLFLLPLLLLLLLLLLLFLLLLLLLLRLFIFLLLFSFLRPSGTCTLSDSYDTQKLFNFKKIQKFKFKKPARFPIKRVQRRIPSYTTHLFLKYPFKTKQKKNWKPKVFRKE